MIRSRALALEASRLVEPVLARGAWQVELVDGQLHWRAPQGSGLKDAGSEPDASLPLKVMLQLLAPFAPDEML